MKFLIANNSFSKNSYLIGVFAVVVAWLGLFGYHGHTPFGFDADRYWELSSRFFKDGHFSLTNFDSDSRGYLYPLLLLIPRAIVYYVKIPAVTMVIVLGALQAALLFGWIIPALYTALRPQSLIRPISRIFFVGLCLFFWIGYFNYTLSDFPGLLAFCSSLLLLVTHSRAWWKIVAAGALLGAALNIRPAYQICLPVLLVLVAWPSGSSAYTWGVRLRQLAFFVIGILFVLLPQWQINRKYFQQNTPMVVANFGDKKEPLQLLQVSWGLKVQKAETAFHSAPGGHSAQILYLDRLGEQLLHKMGYSTADPYALAFRKMPDYFATLARHPLDALIIYAAHLFNGLDQHHNTPYILRPIQQFAWQLPVVNYAVGFCFLLLLWMSRKRLLKLNSTQLLVLAAGLLPCIVGCIVSTETRFLLPLHLLIYAAVCFEWLTIYGVWAKAQVVKKAVLVTLLSLFVAGCFSFSSYVFAQQTIIVAD